MGLGKLQAFLMGVFGGAVSGQGATTGQALVKQANGSWAPGTVGGGATVTASEAFILGAATTAGVRLDLESGVLAVREGDDSAYADLRVNGLNVGAGISVDGNLSGSGTLGSFLTQVIAMTASDGIGPSGTGGYMGAFTNEGAAGEVILTLQPAAAGMRFSFVVQAAQYLRVKASAGDTVRVAGTASASGGYARNNTVGSSIEFLAINATEWVAVQTVGTWTVDS